MTTDCENLLKKFLILNPNKRHSLESIMNDRWMNTGFEEDDKLGPAVEAVKPPLDQERIDVMVKMGYTRSEITHALSCSSFNEVYATYHLLGTKPSKAVAQSSPQTQNTRPPQIQDRPQNVPQRPQSTPFSQNPPPFDLAQQQINLARQIVYQQNLMGCIRA
eukprot:sb/3472762/